MSFQIFKHLLLQFDSKRHLFIESLAQLTIFLRQFIEIQPQLLLVLIVLVELVIVASIFLLHHLLMFGAQLRYQHIVVGGAAIFEEN